MGERSLVLFTLLTQAACGALVGVVGVQLLSDLDALGPLTFIVVGLALLIAAIISTLHLGAPRHAPFALLNWRHSWLSREIIGLGLVGGLVALGALIGLASEPEASLAARTLVGVLAAAAGIFLLVAMIRLYSVRTVTEWRPAATAVRFSGSSLRLGGVSAGLLVAIAALPGGEIGASVLWLGLMLAVGLGLELLLSRLSEADAKRDAGALLVRAAPSPAANDDPAIMRLALGVALAGLGLALLLPGASWLALLLLLAGILVSIPAEVRLRERFYDLAPRQGRAVARPRTVRA